MRTLLRRPNLLAFPGTRPGFDPSHVAARAAFLSVIPSGGNFIDLLTGRLGAPFGGTIIGQINGAIGPVINTNGTNSGVTFSIPAAQTTQTVGAFFQLASPSSTVNVLLQTVDASSQGFMLLNVNGAMDVQTQGTTFSSGLSLSANTPYFVCASQSGASANLVLVNLRTGAIQSSVISTAAILTTGSAAVVANFAGNGFQAEIMGPTMMSNGYTPLQGLLQWAQDPWAFWYPQKFDFMQMLKAPAGGGIVNTLSAAVGAFAMSGKAATPNAARSLSAAQGSFSLSGKPTTLNRGIQMSAAAGAFSVNGVAASFPRARTMAAAQGAFTVSGIAAGLFRGRTINAAQGSFALNGVSASFPVALSIKPVNGVFTVGGGATVLTKTPAGGSGAVSHSNPFFSTPGPGTALP